MGDKTDLIQSIEQKFRIMFRQVQRDLNDLFKGDNITSHEFIFLKRLSLEEPVKISDISREMNVTASYATAVTDRLLQRGYVNRNRSEVDRRIVELTSTDKGKELLKEMEIRRSDYLLKLYSHLSNEELKILDILMEKIQKVTINEND